MTASALYDGHLLHTRGAPARNTFRYRIFTWLIDLDELPELERHLHFFGSDRRALVMIRRRDHLGNPALPIKDNVTAYLRSKGVDIGSGQILMLCNARVLGYVFDPVTLFYCHAESGALQCVVAEVHNTFGERHCYLLTLDDAARTEQDKEFHVSPFLSLDGRYRMQLPLPGEKLRVEMVLMQAGSDMLRAVMVGDRLPLTTKNMVRMLCKHPLLTHRVTALIHWHALRNVFRGLKYYRRPFHPHQPEVS